MRGWMLASVMTAACWTGAQAQGGMAAAPAAGAMVEPAKAFDALLSGFEKDVVPAAEAMPAEKYDFSPDSLHIPGAKYTGVLTFAGEVRHLAEANFGLAAALSGTKPPHDHAAMTAMTSKAQLVEALKESFLVAHSAVATLTSANENDAAGHGMSKAALAAYIPTHGFDHYGQIVEYLRMNGIVPPASAK